VARQPEAELILNNLAWTLSEGLNRPEEALKIADALVERSGRAVQALGTRGVILTRLRRFDAAIQDLEAAVRTTPSAQRHLHLAHAYHVAGRDSDARRSLERARAAGLKPEGLDPTERGAYATLTKP
jgi:tetratricopeptide (TPR) repeat protein